MKKKFKKREIPDRRRAKAPAVWGQAIEVPFISWLPRFVNLGTEVIAPPMLEKQNKTIS